MESWQEEQDLLAAPFEKKRGHHLNCIGDTVLVLLLATTLRILLQQGKAELQHS